MSFKSYTEAFKAEARKRAKLWYENNKDKSLQYHKEHYQKNKERINKKHRGYYRENKVILARKNKEWRIKNKEVLKKASREYYLANKKSILGKSKIYTAKNKERVLLCKRLWQQENKKQLNERRKEKRHARGISNKYQTGISKTKKYKKLHDQRYRHLKIKGGELSIKTIQLVYEDNIKQYGTLTCYLCEHPILFGKDNLEHKTPLSRGGTNNYSNLAIACRSCNSRKNNRTEKEYRYHVSKMG